MGALFIICFIIEEEPPRKTLALLFICRGMLRIFLAVEFFVDILESLVGNMGVYLGGGDG